MTESDDIKRMRDASGAIVSSDKEVVRFIYLLGRDHMGLGTIEQIMDSISSETVIYTNGWLAQYAKDVANRLNPLNPVPKPDEEMIKWRDNKIESLNNAIARFEKCLVRIAEAHGLDTPWQLMVTAKNNEENYAELLARYIEEQLGRNDDKEKDYV
jgi:hypothetical protein